MRSNNKGKKLNNRHNNKKDLYSKRLTDKNSIKKYNFNKDNWKMVKGFGKNRKKSSRLSNKLRTMPKKLGKWRKKYKYNFLKCKKKGLFMMLNNKKSSKLSNKKKNKFKTLRLFKLKNKNKNNRLKNS